MRIFSRRTPARRSVRGAALQIAVCGDPETTMQLMGVRGQLDQTTIAALALGFGEIADGVSLHLDVTDLEIADPSVMPHLERLVDHLEARQIRLRVVGFEPGRTARGDDRLHS